MKLIKQKKSIFNLKLEERKYTYYKYIINNFKSHSNLKFKVYLNFNNLKSNKFKNFC